MKTLLLLLIASPLFGQSLPDAPSAKVADKYFWAVTSADAVFTGLDAYTTVALIGTSPHSCPYEADTPYLYGLHPTVRRTTLAMGAMFAISELATYQLKKHHVRIWKIPLWPLPAAYESYVHGRAAIGNFGRCH